MKNDRLRNDKDEIHNLGDLIEARSSGTSHISADVDAFEKDIDIPDDIDVDEALTFPHPKPKLNGTEGIELMGTPHESDMEEDWDAQDTQPTDYEHRYDEATDTHATDDMDEVAEEQIDIIGHLTVEDIESEEPTELLHGGFKPEDEPA